MPTYYSSLLLSLVILVACNSGGGGNGNSSSNGGETPVSGVEDPLYAQAWHLENTGQKSFSSGAGISGQDFNIKEVIDSGIKGQGVKIAISDTGVDLNHLDLNGNQLVNQHRDYSSDDSSTWRGTSPYPIEYEGHGTAVTGLVSAIGKNGIGSRGVAPSSQFAGFLFIGGFHNNAASYEAKTLDQMVGPFDIFNYSYGYAGCEFVPTTSSVIDTYKAGVTTRRAGKGAIYIQAAGNEYIGDNEDCYPGDNSQFLGNTNTSEDHNHPYVILAAASNANGTISSYSTPGSGVWVTSAGGEFGTTSPAMISTDILGCTYGLSTSSSTSNSFNKGTLTSNSSCDYTSIMNGTSSAAPVLSGIVALMLEANPALTWRDVKHILAVTADKINFSTSSLTHPGGGDLAGHTYDYNYVTNTAGISFSNKYGFGRVNAQNAVNMAKTYVSTLGSYKETVDATTGAWLYSSSPNSNIPDNNSVGVTDTINVTHSYTIESVQIKLTTDHTYVGDLGVELVAPSNTRSKLLLINSNIQDSGLTDFTLLTNAFYGENSSGNWTIKIIDGAAADTGKLSNWKLKINGH